jgi:hypothetical protein
MNHQMEAEEFSLLSVLEPTVRELDQEEEG